MKKLVNIETIFPKHLFWDMDYNKLNLSRDKDIIIPRALYATTPDTFEEDIKIRNFIFIQNDCKTPKTNYRKHQ